MLALAILVLPVALAAFLFLGAVYAQGLSTGPLATPTFDMVKGWALIFAPAWGFWVWSTIWSAGVVVERLS